ncbi:MAG: NAD-dependent epimerase/dehydratase family protein [Nitrososphaerales archaeon]|nr:NAD-dependent epimerase/dehydratase family protein [Nitrososphaerales archaeon]
MSESDLLKALITGGAGFIGSSLSEALVNLGWNLNILDNISSGSRDNLVSLNGKKSVKLVVGDCTKKADVKKTLTDVDVVFHFSANPEVRLELNNPRTCFKENVFATYVLLEEMRRSRAHTMVFSSTSTVYGDAMKIPTPEDYTPLEPISLYGASKLASEALITAYSHTYGMKAVILRLANIVGPRSRHGIVKDFVTKLKKDSRELEILGDGSQTKSYVFIDDCIEAILKAYEAKGGRVEVFNIGSEDQIGVKRIAKIVCDEMGLKGVKFNFTGGLDGGRGWKGDVKSMLLDTAKLRSRGWRPGYNSEEAVRLTVRGVLGQTAPSKLPTT